MSLPEVPSYPEYASLLSLRTAAKDSPGKSTSTSLTATKTNEQALSILKLAEQALLTARKEWEAVSKANAEAARCIGCEDWWRTSVRNVVRSCITANIMITTAKKAVAIAGCNHAGNVLSLEMVESGKGYHAWWIVPRISSK